MRWDLLQNVELHRWRAQNMRNDILRRQNDLFRDSYAHRPSQPMRVDLGEQRYRLSQQMRSIDRMREQGRQMQRRVQEQTVRLAQRTWHAQMRHQAWATHSRRFLARDLREVMRHAAGVLTRARQFGSVIRDYRVDRPITRSAWDFATRLFDRLDTVRDASRPLQSVVTAQRTGSFNTPISSTVMSMRMRDLSNYRFDLFRQHSLLNQRTFTHVNTFTRVCIGPSCR